MAPTGEEIDFDVILRRIGAFGRFQRVRYFFLCLVSVLCGFAAVSWVFQAYDSPHRCRVPYCETHAGFPYYGKDGKLPLFVDPNTVDSCQYLQLVKVNFKFKVRIHLNSKSVNRKLQSTSRVPITFLC